MRRGGRIDIDIRMDMPQDYDRFEIFKEHLRLLPHQICDEDLLMIARASSGFVTSDIAQIVRNCHMRALKNQEDHISKQNLEA